MPTAKLKQTVWAVFKYFTLVLGGFISVLPLVVCVITAFKTPEEYASTNVMTLPQNWGYIENFIQAWKQANMGVAFRNSIIILVFVLCGSVLTGSMIAYVLSRFKFKGNGLIRAMFLMASLLPGIAMQVSVYQIMYTIGWINFMPGYIIMMCGTDIISIYIFIQFLKIFQQHWTNQQLWTVVLILVFFPYPIPTSEAGNCNGHDSEGGGCV